MSLRRTAPLARKPMKRGGPVKKRNAKRRAAEFERCFGSRERVRWIKSLPCIVTEGHSDDIENVHTRGDGAGRRADACWIVPMKASLHRKLHRVGKVSFECEYGIDLDFLATVIESGWQVLQSRKAA
jgi:hypothetical protein